MLRCRMMRIERPSIEPSSASAATPPPPVSSSRPVGRAAEPPSAAAAAASVVVGGGGGVGVAVALARMSSTRAMAARLSVLALYSGHLAECTQQ